MDLFVEGIKWPQSEHCGRKTRFDELISRRDRAKKSFSTTVVNLS